MATCTRGWWRSGPGRRTGVAATIVAGALLCVGLLPAGTPPAAAQAASPPTCGYAPTRRSAEVREPAVREASALVASQRWPGVYWTLNDSGNAPVLYAIDQDGTARGEFRVSGAVNTDWEALALGPDGAGGYVLYIGDVGDNDQMRTDPVIYRVPEPEPSPAGGAAVSGETVPATALRFVFPGRPHNVEALLVHPVTGEIVLVSREVTGLSLVYRLPAEVEPGLAPMADFIDVVDVRSFEPASGQVTDGAVSADGQQVVLRTYAAALVYDLPAGASLASIWAEQPRVYPLGDGPKGEGIAFRAGSRDLVTIGEERPAALYQTAWPC